MSFGTIKRNENGDGPDFRRKHVSASGITSVVFGLAAVALFIMAGMISSKAHGFGDERVGFLGIAAFVICIIGATFAGAGFKEKEVSYVFPYIGLGINASMLVYLLYLFLYGLF